MDFELVFRELLKAFEENKIRFALIGGFALNIAGFARATQDIDFLIEAEDINKTKKIMLKLGCVDFLHAHRTYARSMLKRAKNHKILKQFEVPVIIPEDMIGLKVQSMANDPKRESLDMADIEYLLEEKGEGLDMGLIREYFDLFQLGHKLERISEKRRGC